ncbi:MAG: hypothetical protein ACC742_04335 [Thermoanaerobaculales bacterium]
MRNSVILLVLGVLLFLVCLTADVIGLGPSPGLGWKQILGAVVGVVIAAIGMIGIRRQ